ncbi:hypothetical protein SUNI508_09934 [Seiridium unicorne]|uniref:Uncharacterized protein n=1 Tax=Seiridium unicorne TaxID=138068 RepID=A0ABR2UN85_9PEZI
MGAYVSIPDCRSHYNVTLNCTIGNYSDTTHKYESLGNITAGEFKGNPDIGGIGVLGAFLGVTAFALLLSIVDVLWQIAKAVGWKQRSFKENQTQTHKKWSATDIMEALVQACSDQQIFTGAAYAVTLRYSQGCSISAYHYNLVSNIVLLTCATHLMTVTIASSIEKTLVLPTGVLMSNQNVSTDPKVIFPTAVPPANETDSLMFLPAACFQDSNAQVSDTFKQSFAGNEQFFVNTIGNSTPKNKIQGWNMYIVMLLFYIAALIVEFIRWWRRGAKRVRSKYRKGLVDMIGRWFPKAKPYGRFFRKVVEFSFLIYLLGGIAISCATVILSGQYIFALRGWVDRSGWLQLDNGQNPENDATTFGQLVPIFLTALTFFTLMGIISEKGTEHRNRKHPNEEKPNPNGTIAYLDPSQYDFGNGQYQNLGPQVRTPALTEEGLSVSVGHSYQPIPQGGDLKPHFIPAVSATSVSSYHSPTTPASNAFTGISTPGTPHATTLGASQTVNHSYFPSSPPTPSQNGNSPSMSTNTSQQLLSSDATSTAVASETQRSVGRAGYQVSRLTRNCGPIARGVNGRAEDISLALSQGQSSRTTASEGDTWIEGYRRRHGEDADAGDGRCENENRITLHYRDEQLKRAK